MMKNILIIITAVLFLASCSSKTVSDSETKSQELQRYKQEMHDLKQKIDILENELSSNVEEDIINVKVTKLDNRLFEHFIEVTGKVEADLDIDISPESIGSIESIFVKEGQNVSKGEVLAKLKSDALERSLDEMQIQLELANTTFKRQKNLWDQNIGSELQFLQAKTNKESLEKRIEGIKSQIKMALVKSPINGVVDIIYQKKGQIGSPQAPFAKVLNINQIKVYAEVSESYITKIHKGDKVSINFPALESEIETPIYRIGNIIDPNNRTFKVRVNLNNKDRKIKPNLVCILKIRDYVSENAIVVPSLLVKEDFKGFFTYIVDKNEGQTTAKKVYITPGVTNNNMTEITEGLTVGMELISEGYNQIFNGSSIQF